MSVACHDSLRVTHAFTGRVVYARSDGTVYASRGYTVYSSCDDGRTWNKVTALPISPGRRLGQVSRLASRLLRSEVKALGLLSDGTHVTSNREWVFYAPPGDPVMTRSAVDEQGQALKPPMTMTVGPNDRVLWGEYNSKLNHNLPVRLYVSDDRGRSYEVAHVFEAGSILHVHNIIYDQRLQRYWVLTGDHKDEPGIGRLSADLRDYEWVRKGEQCYRAVELFDFGDRLIYATDTQWESNALMSMDKTTGQVERLMELEGSCIYACRFGGLYALTTSVEPSPVNSSRYASLWLSRDGEHWRRVFQAEKDRWNSILFQFGSLVLPRGASDREVILFSGQAVKGVDGKVMVAKLVGGWPS